MASISLSFGKAAGVTSCQDCEASRVILTKPLVLPAQRTEALTGEGVRTVREVRRGRCANSKSSLPPASRSSRSTASSSSFRGECVFADGADSAEFDGAAFVDAAGCACGWSAGAPGAAAGSVRSGLICVQLAPALVVFRTYCEPR